MSLGTAQADTRALDAIAMDTPSPHAPDASWRHQLPARVAALWWIKMVSNMAGMAVFFVAYFWALHHPQFPVTVMPLTWVDHWVAFEPAAMPLYLSLWVYVSLPLALLKDRRELVSYGLATLALSVIGLGVFFAYPSAVPAFGIDWSQYPSVAFLKAADVGGNACPSLHVAFAVFSAVWLERLLREMNVGMPVRLLNLAWCVGIVYSTLATRQHVALDVLAGGALGLVVVVLHLVGLSRFERQRTRAAARRPSPGLAALTGSSSVTAAGRSPVLGVDLSQQLVQHRQQLADANRLGEVVRAAGRESRLDL